jgi:hypothetical protein
MTEVLSFLLRSIHLANAAIGILALDLQKDVEAVGYFVDQDNGEHEARSQILRLGFVRR